MLRVLCFLFALCFGSVTQAQEGGRIERFIEDSLSGDGRIVEITNFSGALSSRATLDRLTIADETGVWLVMSDAVLDWTRASLLRGTLDVNELSAARIEILRAPVSSGVDVSDSEAPGFAIPELPVTIRIDKLAVPDIRLGETLLGEPMQVAVTAKALLEGGAADIAINAERKDSEGQFDIVAAFDPSREVLSLRADLNEPENGLVVRALALPGTPALRLVLDGSGPLDDFQAELQLQTDGQDRLTGIVTLDRTDPTTRRFAADIEGDIRPMLDAETGRFFGRQTKLTADGFASEDGAITLQALDLSTAQMRLTGSARLAPGGIPDQVELTGTLQGENGVLLPGSQVRLEGAELSVSFDAPTSPDWTLMVEASGLDTPDAQIALTRLIGTGILTPGTAQPFEGRISLRSEGIALRDPALQKALGTKAVLRTGLTLRNPVELSLEGMTLETAHATLRGAAQVLPKDGQITLALDSALELPDLAPFSELATPLQAGNLKAELRASAALPAGTFTASLIGTTQGLDIGNAQVAPLLTPLTRLNVALTRDEIGTRLESLKLSSSALTLDATGALSTEDGFFTLAAELNELNQVVPQLNGPLRLNADVTGLPSRPKADLKLAMRGAEAVGTLDILPQGDTFAVNYVSDLTIPDISPFAALTQPLRRGSMRANIRGTATLPDADGELVLTGTTRGLDINIPVLEPLLRPETDLTVSVSRAGDLITLRSATLDSTAMEARVSGSVGQNSSAMTLTARLSDLGQIVSTLPGPVQISADLSDLLGSPDIAARVNSASGINAQISGEVGLPGGRVDLTSTGQLPLGLAQPFLTSQTISGLARFDLRVDGPPALASVRGQINTRDARLADPVQRLVLFPLSANVQLNNARAAIAANGSLNKGDFRLSGDLGLTPPYPTDLSLQISALPYRFEDVLRSRINGQITLSGTALRQIAIGGQVQLSDTQIRVPDTGLGTADPIPVIKHFGLPRDVARTLSRADLPKTAQSSQTNSGPRLPIDLKIVALDPIFVRGRGLDAEFGGQLQVTGTVFDPIPVGQFQLRRGRMSLLGQRLDLDEGTITAAGRLIPRLRIVAESARAEVTAQIVLEGPADAPELKLQSTPELPEDEILAFLLFGRSVTSLSGFQIARLISSLSELSGGGPGLVERTRRKLGFDDLDIRTDATTGETELAIGQYVTENIYSEVELGAQGNSQLNLNLDLSDTTRLRGSVTSTGETGIGIFWERDY